MKKKDICLKAKMDISKEDMSRFPITTTDEFVGLFESHIRRALDDGTEPNLAFLSIVLGYLESRLTLTESSDVNSSNADSTLGSSGCRSPSNQQKVRKNGDASAYEEYEGGCDSDFPILEFEVVEALYLKFSILVKSVIDRTMTENTTRSGTATRFLCKKVSDLLWNRLYPHYHKDKAHIQSLFSFLTGRQLDCFGLAIVVIAACQILKYSDVHLGMSEDHAWAIHGDKIIEMTEITWHGKGTEDRRGWSLKKTDTEKSWMYLSGNGIMCTRMMEIASMVVAINPSIDAHTDSGTLCVVQHKLLRLMMEIGALEKYPLGMSLLAEFDNSEELHKRSVKSVEKYYDGGHALPYSLQGQFYSRNGNHKAAISCWANASQVLTRYNYTREDEEVYREIMDIAKEYIPFCMKSDPSICEDRECFLDLIRFYDGICLWEEGSSTPVLHSWWAKYFTHTLGRFPAEVRSTFKIDVSDDEDESGCSNSSTQNVKHSLRNDDSTIDDSSDATNTISTLGVRSSKMKGLENLLVGSKKFNAHAVSLQLTAQSQVHLSRKRPGSGPETTTEYSGRIKKPKKFFE